MTRIPTPKISEVLKYDFMQPINLSAYALAKAIYVPTSRIQDILHDRRQITPDTSIRLGRFFGVTDGYLLRIQNDINLRNLELKYNQDYKQIKQRQKA